MKADVRTSLEAEAVRYLAQREASTQELFAALSRAANRLAARGELVPDEAGRLIEEIVARHKESRTVDDGRYAAQKGAGLHKQGKSVAQIRAWLEDHGVGDEDQQRAIEALGKNEATLDLEAATAVAKKLRIGPFRRPEERSAQHDKDLAALARRGFTEEIVLRVIGAPRDSEES